jgi:hypothetical protein
MAPPRRIGLRHLALAAALAGLLFLALRRRGPTPSEDALFEGAPTRPAASNTQSRTPSAGPISPRPRPGAPPAGPADEAREIAERRLERARHTLDSYLLSTRYPPGSRPLSEHPDVARARSVPASTQPLARKDGKLTDARVTLTQDRYFLVGDEAARLTVSCVTSEGPATCEVALAEARVAPTMPGASAFPAAPVPFRDDGTGGDAAPADGAPTALFAPARQGFGGYHGPLRVDLLLRVDGEEGTAAFDLQYTPAAPARFTGRVREALEDGSLCLYASIDVDEPGRYVLTARADDADGKGLALLELSEVLPAGVQEARMCLFGKLVRDHHARSPFVLRDLEGFLLLENAHPDRALVPALVGPVHTTQIYDESRFSDAPWQSPDKQRHVDEFTKDVAEAEKDLAEIEERGP